MATPVGFCLALAGARPSSAGGTPSLPGFLAAARDRAPGAARAIAAVGRARAWVRRGSSRPRLGRVMSGPGMRPRSGCRSFAAAVVLGLPIPLPLSNFFPAVAILLLALGPAGRGRPAGPGRARRRPSASASASYLAWGAALMGVARVLAWVL